MTTRARRLRCAMPLLVLALALQLMMTTDARASARLEGQEAHPAAPAGTRRAFEIADYFRTASIGPPMSGLAGKSGPGGVVFAVTRYELEAAESWSEIWMINADGSGLRQMTFGRHHDSGPVLTPDGSSLVFVSDRAGEGSQLFVMAVDGGEPRQLTRFPGGVSQPVLSPDGRWIAVTAEVYPECGSDAECNATIRSSVEKGPLTAHVADDLLYRHWTSWRDGLYRHVLLLEAETGSVVRDLTPGRWHSPPLGVGDGGYAFSPEATQLCYVSNHDPRPATSTNADLWVVAIDEALGDHPPTSIGTGNLTADNPAWDGDPRYSPDGRWISFRRQQQPGYESDLYRLALFDRRSGEVRLPLEGKLEDNWVTAIEWSPGGEHLYLQVQEKGRNPIYRLRLDGMKLDKVLQDGGISGWQPISGTGPGDTADAIVYSRSRVGEPPELYRLDRIGGEPRRLTSFNAALSAEVDIRPAEEMWLEGDGGSRIQVFVVKPHGFDPEKSYPLILNVHGGPQYQWLDSYRGDWQVYPGKGYVVAFPNPTGSSGAGQDVVDAISCDWGGRVYRDVMKITDALAGLPWVDGDRLGAMGWSYGGYMMMWLEGHTDRFKALASMMGVYDLRSMYSSTEELWFVEHDLCGTPWSSQEYQRWSPSNHVEAFSTPCLVITGELDYRVPYTQSLMFFTDLRQRDVPARLVVLPGSGHWPGWYEMAFYYLVHLDWFHQWLGGDPPPWEVRRFLRNQVFDNDG